MQNLGFFFTFSEKTTGFGAFSRKKTCRFHFLRHFKRRRMQEPLFCSRREIEFCAMNDDCRIFLGDVPDTRPVSFAVFLSGSGSNAERLLLDPAVRACAVPQLLVTDAPRRSRAAELGKLFQLPVVALDLRDFYRDHGLDTTSLATAEGQRVRELWTDELRARLRGYPIDFGVLAGFAALSNITRDFPCLNVHPGDLGVTDDAGRRVLVGLHTRPVESAILLGHAALRSSVILAESFSGQGDGMDNGILLGVSPEVRMNLAPERREELRKIQAARPPRRPAGGWHDELFRLARREQERLKRLGDHKVLPGVVRDFARRCFAVRNDTLLYRPNPDAPFAPAGLLEYGTGPAPRRLHP